jgi:hypothetical protein
MTSTVQLLIEKGANPLEEDFQGKLPIDLIDFQSYDQAIAEALQTGTKRLALSITQKEIQIDDDEALQDLVLKYSPQKENPAISLHSFSLSSDGQSDVVSFGLDEDSDGQVDLSTPISEYGPSSASAVGESQGTLKASLCFQ